MERQIYDLLYRISTQLDRISRDLQRLADRIDFSVDIGIKEADRNSNSVDTGIKEEDY